MSLDLSKLEKLRELGNGTRQARCPACAETGQDRKGEHLRLYPDGRFGCCVHPKDTTHRKRIFALVGERKRRAIQVRVSSAKSSPLVQGPLLGRLGRLFASQPRANARDAWDAPDEVAESSDDSGTPGTGQSKSAEQLPNHLGTIGTTLNPSAYREKSSVHRERLLPLYAKDIDQGVPSVPSQDLVSESEPTVPTAPRRQPHFTEGGVLVIPFDSDPKYHWWRGGQTIAETRAELSLNLKPNNNP